MDATNPIRLISQDGAAWGATGQTRTLTLRPPKGKNYRVISAVVWHTDATDDQYLYWQFLQHNVAGMRLLEPVKVDQLVRVSINALRPDGVPVFLQPPVLRYNLYAQCGRTSAGDAEGFDGTDTAGCQVKMRAYVEEFDGPDD